MHRSIFLGPVALTCAASCVPFAETRPLAVQAVPDSHALLRGLALDVPQTLDNLPLSEDASSDALARVAAPPFLTGAQAADDAARAADCLTAAIYYEARSEALDGQRAVAQVVLNRVRDRAFPASVCGVVYQGSTRATGCQFSFTCDGSMNRRRDPAAWDRARAVAMAALSGSVYAPVGSATSYHAASVLPWWAPSLSRIGSVGAHVFYRWRDRMERALAFRQSYGGEEPANVPAFDGGLVEARVAVMGVTIRYGNGTSPADDRGVRIHRSVAADARTTQPPVPAGIRVHYGLAGDAKTAAAATSATISDETDTI